MKDSKLVRRLASAVIQVRGNSACTGVAVVEVVRSGGVSIDVEQLFTKIG